MLEADIPTGYIVNKANLRDEERAGPYHIWKRSRFTRQKVYLHLDYVRCITFYCLDFKYSFITLLHKFALHVLNKY